MQLKKYERREKHNVSEQTLKPRLSALNNLQDFIGEGKEVTPDDVEEWVDHLIQRYEDGDMSAGTIKQYYKAAKYYFETVHGGSEDIQHIRNWIPVGSTDHGDFLDKQEWKRMLDKTNKVRNRAILHLMYEYARRPGEIRLINESDITFSEDRDVDEDKLNEDEEVLGLITFNILKKKDKDLPVMELYDRGSSVANSVHRVFRATFELTPECERLIKTWMRYKPDFEEEMAIGDEMEIVKPLFTTSHGRISHDTVWGDVKKIAKRAEIDKNITPKSMRHSRTTHLDWEGNDPAVIARQQLLHSADSNVVGNYIHDRDEDAVRKVMKTEDEE